MFDPQDLEQKTPQAVPPGQEEPRLTTAQKKKVEQVELEQARGMLEEEKAYRRGLISIKDLIAPAALEVQNSYIKLGDYFVRTIFIVQYPRYIHVGWFAPIINMDITADISLYFYPVDSSVILKQLKKKVGVLEAGLISDAEKGAPRDPLRETALRDMEKLRDDLTQGVEHFFQTAMYTTVYAKTMDDLDTISERVENVFGSTLVFSKRVFYQAEQGFNSTLPLSFDELEILEGTFSKKVGANTMIAL